MTDLLNCPFCGGEMQLRYALWPSEGDRDAVIHNVPGGTSCPIEGAFSIDTFDNGVSVAEAWNRRPLLDELDASKARIAEVRPLEWDGEQAASPFGTYEISIWNTARDEWKWRAPDKLRDVWTAAGQVNGAWRQSLTKEEAKAAAQADYAARILSALTPPPRGDAK
jgi:hypothetical protein